MRIFSDIKVRNGPDANGLYTIQRVPIQYGDPSSMVAQLIKGASENTMLPSPMFSAYIDSIRICHERRQDSQYVGKVSTVERKFNKETQTYSDEPGVRQDVERYMPVPYDLYLKLDIWTTNMDTKLQIFEQIAVIFNHSVQLQSNSNLLDWSNIFEVWLEDMTFSNRSVPQGGTEERDVLTLKFKTHIWINPPAKITQSRLVAEIVSQVYQTSAVSELKSEINGFYDPFGDAIAGIPVQIVTTEGNHKIKVSKVNGSDEITLLNAYGQTDPSINWANLIQKYGQITPNITTIRLKLDPDLDVTDSDIIGYIQQDPTRPDTLLFTPDLDTLPGTTLPPIADIIDPTEIFPGSGLPSAAAGQRYLLTSVDNLDNEPAIPPNVPTSPWGQFIVAYPNDIIEFNGISWVVIFDSRNASGLNYVINNSNGSQYTFDGTDWSYTYYGIYSAGYWRIDNIISAPNGTTINIYE